MKDNRQVIILVLALIVLLVLFRRVSGFIVTPETIPLSMMDLKEFSYLTADQKSRYRGLLVSRAPLFTSNTTNFNMYMQNVQGLMSTVISNTPGYNTNLNLCPNSNILMGVCQTAPGICPRPMTGTLYTMNDTRYCKCPMTTPYLRRTANTMTSGAVCSVTPCDSTQQRTVTETVSGQRECVNVCPETLLPGTTCV
jgi:hypothetical protein